MRVPERGRITIPKALRDRFGMNHHIEVEITPTSKGFLTYPRGLSKAERVRVERGVPTRRRTAPPEAALGPVVHLGQGGESCQGIGVAISGGLTAPEIADCAERAEALGYESVWVAEGHGRRSVRDPRGLCAPNPADSVSGPPSAACSFETAPTNRDGGCDGGTSSRAAGSSSGSDPAIGSRSDPSTAWSIRNRSGACGIPWLSFGR